MVRYDPRVIQAFADRLYSRARTIAVVYTILGLLVGGIGGFLIPDASLRLKDPLPLVIGGAVGLGFICLLLGLARGFTLRLTAQQALCQLEIESNTRQLRSVPT